MRLLVRLLLGLIGLLAFAIAAQFWLAPDRVAGQFGLTPVGSLGLASLRADLGGFFTVAGGFCLAAGVRNQAGYLTAPLALLSVALISRSLTALTAPPDPGMTQPIVVEAVLVAILMTAQIVLRRR